MPSFFFGNKKSVMGGEGRASQGPTEDEEWTIGGRYKIKRASVPVYETRELKDKKMCELGPTDVVLLLQVWGSAGDAPAGLVVPSDRENTSKVPGWIALEDSPSQPKGTPPPVERKKLEDSWELRARYIVNHPATLREGPSLISKQVGEVEPEEEILVLELSLTTCETDGRARLRAHVSTDKGVIGWLSPENGQGDMLLEPVNMLGPKVVEIHRKSLAVSNAGLAGGDRKTSGPRKSCSTTTPMPWKVGNQYRILEKITLSPGEPNGKTTIPLAAGVLVTINEIKASGDGSEVRLDQIPQPVALVTVNSGEKVNKEGWVNLTAKDGHDVVDTRDQHEFEKVVEKLRQSQVAGNINSHAENESEDQGGGDGESSGGEGSGSDEEEESRSRNSDAESKDKEPVEEAVNENQTPRTSKAKGGKGGTPQLEKFEEFSGQDETRQFTEGHTIEGGQQWCGCKCTR